jgi:DnaJ-class molecular chaperone
MKCPRCNGDGQIIIRYQPLSGLFKGTKLIPCPDCKGTGIAGGK